MGDIVTGLIGYWTLDSTLADSAGANDLAWGGGGSPVYEAGQIGNAGVLDGSHYYDTGVTNIGGIGLFAEAAETFSVSLWFKTTDISSLLAKAGATAGDRTFQLFTQSDRVRFFLRGTIQEGPVGFMDGEWHHAVLTWDGSAADLYVDNTLVLADAVAGSAAEETSENIIIGARTGGTGGLMVGSLDDVRIYDRVTVADDVNDLFNFTGAGPSAVAAAQYYRRLAGA